MASYHISLFDNSSNTKSAVTAKRSSNRDTYSIEKHKTLTPSNNVEIAKGSWTSYDQAFPNANFIYTGSFSYCFWDDGKRRIAAVTDQEPTKIQVIYGGSAGDNNR
jgi:hypothetical protein